MTSTTPLNNRASQRRDCAPLSQADALGLVWLHCALTITALLVAGSGGLKLHSSHAPVLYHNAKYVFAISSRFNADDSVKGWKEATEIVGRNGAANAPHLYPR